VSTWHELQELGGVACRWRMVSDVEIYGAPQSPPVPRLGHGIAGPRRLELRSIICRRGSILRIPP